MGILINIKRDKTHGEKDGYLDDKGIAMLSSHYAMGWKKSKKWCCLAKKGERVHIITWALIRQNMVYKTLENIFQDIWIFFL